METWRNQNAESLTEESAETQNAEKSAIGEAQDCEVMVARSSHGTDLERDIATAAQSCKGVKEWRHESVKP